MKSKHEQSEPFFWQKIAQLPFVQGPIIGSTVMALVTPGLNWTNHVMNAKPMIWRNAMSGVFVYSSSAIPTFATVFMIKKVLQRKESTPAYDIFSSFIAGGISGLVGTPFDTIAQNKQLATISSSKETRQKMVRNNGYRSLFQGAGVTTVREGIWSTIYLTLVRELSKHLSNQGINKNQADALALIMTAGSYGFFSTPLNQLRSRKQINLTEPAPIKSYMQHAKEIWNEKPQASSALRCASFFKGSLPRTITLTAAAGCLVKGQELYEQLIGSPQTVK